MATKTKLIDKKLKTKNTKLEQLIEKLNKKGVDVSFLLEQRLNNKSAMPMSLCNKLYSIRDQIKPDKVKVTIKDATFMVTPYIFRGKLNDFDIDAKSIKFKPTDFEKFLLQRYAYMYTDYIVLNHKDEVIKQISENEEFKEWTKKYKAHRDYINNLSKEYEMNVDSFL